MAQAWLIIIQTNLDHKFTRQNFIDRVVANHPAVTDFRFIPTLNYTNPLTVETSGLRFWANVVGSKSVVNAITTDLVNNYHAAFPTHKIIGETIEKDIILEF